jgi:hypothetical protein
MAKPKKKFAQLRGELAETRQRLFERLVPLAVSDLPPTDQSEQAHLRRTLWSCVRELDSLLDEPAAEAEAAVDLTSGDEATQRILYARVLKDYFLPLLLDDAGCVSIPPYTPEQAGLRVYFEHGRWFVTWMKLEEDKARPESERRELLVFEKNESGALLLREV